MAALIGQRLGQEALGALANGALLFLLAGFPMALDMVRGWAPQPLVDAFAGLSFLTHFQAITRGVLDLRDVVFFLLCIGAWLLAGPPLTLGGLVGAALMWILVGSLIETAEEASFATGWQVPLGTDVVLCFLVGRMVFGPGHPALHLLLLLAIATDSPEALPVAPGRPVLDLNRADDVATWLVDNAGWFDYAPPATP